MRRFLSLAVAAMVAVMTNAQSDYITELPLTVYEATTITPQNMDFDMVNNMFTAHSGWYNDKLIHYYKFRMYTPGTYEGVIVPGGANVIPIGDVHMVTTTGDFTGVVGSPIIQYHNGADGTDYSDFVRVNFITAPADYVADTFKSVGDVVDSGATITPTDIILNLPVVPTGATLQDPVMMGTNKAPINPTPVWYKGMEVWTYVFEVTDQSAADFFADTRTTVEDDTTATARAASDYAIPVVPFASTSDVSRIPIWHLNQFNFGVTAGENGGGPDPAGMRNVINLDRPDPGYSPLWQVYWATEVPINYSADQASNAATMTEANGFKFFTTPMYVNCPDIGPVGDMNTVMLEEFQLAVDVDLPKNVIIGSDPTLIMQAGVHVHLLAHTEEEGEDHAGDVMVGHADTNGMGGYEFTLMTASIPEGAEGLEVTLEGHDEEEMDMDEDEDHGHKDIVIREIEIIGGETTEDVSTSAAFSRGMFAGVFAVFAMLL